MICDRTGAERAERKAESGGDRQCNWGDDVGDTFDIAWENRYIRQSGEGNWITDEC